MPRFRSASLATLTIVCAATSPAQSLKPALPATPVGQLAADWIRLCEQPNHDQMMRWQTAHLSDESVHRLPAGPRADFQFALCTANGGFRVAEFTQSAADTIRLQMIGKKSGTWISLTIMANDAGKLEGDFATPSTPTESAMPRDLSDAALAAEVRRIVARVSEAGLFSGIVTVARGTHVIAQVSGGYANRARRTPTTGATQFTLGSMGKMFTAASIGQLVDRGNMSFDDHVGKFFPDYPNAAVRDQVTVGMLLSHTAGLGDFLARRTPDMMTKGVARAAEFMPLYDQDAPRFPPGTQWAYSNAGLALAGAIVEKVSGENYPDYIRKHIFVLAGMTDSDPNNRPHASPALVTPYTKFTPQGPSPDWVEAPADIGSPAGGAISTADDLVRFADALRSGRLVQPQTFAALTKPRQTVPTGDKYGYAMEIVDVYGRTVVGHGGGFPGVSTHLYLVLGSPYTVVVLGNQDPPSDGYVGRMTLALVAEKAKRGQ
jgi:CubicO group peptidase (beta-lactamase class C family)